MSVAPATLAGRVALNEPPELRAHGYLEEEWFVAGSADAFDPDGARIAGDVPYLTRFLLRRPVEGSLASGSLFLEPLHMIGEMPATWASVGDWMMRSGHAWVGVSVHNSSFGELYGFPGGIEALKQQDQERYGPLRLETYQRPPRMRSYPGPSTDSFTLTWTMAMAHPQGHPIVADVADLVRTSPELAAASAQRVYGCGASQTAHFWRLFLDHGWHELRRRADGRPLLDAYGLVVSAAPAHRPVDAVLVNVLSEAEVVGTIVQSKMTAPPDCDVPRVRGIELAGAPHVIGHDQVERPVDDHLHTKEPYQAVLKAIFHALDRWVREGVAMPHVPLIARDPSSVDGIVRDEHGNAVGGVRVPWLEAPRAQYLPRCACGPTLGEVVPFAPEKTGRLYPDDADHERRWRRAVDRLVEDRLLLEHDVEPLLQLRTNREPAEP